MISAQESALAKLHSEHLALVLTSEQRYAEYETAATAATAEIASLRKQLTDNKPPAIPNTTTAQSLPVQAHDNGVSKTTAITTKTTQHNSCNVATQLKQQNNTNQ